MYDFLTYMPGFRGGQNTLRSRLFQQYQRNLGQPPKGAPSALTIETFIDGIRKYMKIANTQYDKRPRNGLWYAKDYVNLHSPDDKWRPINGLTNPNYWDVKRNNNLFVAKEDQSPSDCLNAFFHGPTFADCGNVMQAVLYRSIENMIGTERFNALFDKAISPFIISQDLFCSIQSISGHTDISFEDKMRLSNPLYFLFDQVENYGSLSEDEIEIGDIVYIQGVDKYKFKHLAGFALGWNVICVGKNESGDNLYLGFGPNVFQEPLTYVQIEKILIDGYNAPQSADTQEILNNLNNKDSLTFEQETHKESATLLVNDIVDDSYKIVGIKYAIRFDINKLKQFCSQTNLSWQTLIIDSEIFESNASEIISIHAQNALQVLKSSLPSENREKSFFDYQVETEQQRQMFELSKKFAQSVIKGEEEPKGLIFSGIPGIGKTQLAVNVAKMVQQYGKRVLFVSAEALGNEYQHLCEENNGFYPDEKLIEYYNNKLTGFDLIVLDDINSNLGSENQFLQLAINYVFSSNSAIMITSNSTIKCFKEKIPFYVGYDSYLNDNFVIYQDLEGNSARKGWWESLISREENISKYKCELHLLSSLPQHESAGLILEASEIDLQKTLSQYKKINPACKARIADAPYKNNKVFDFFFHDSKDFDTFLIKVTSRSEAEQLLNLVDKVHDQGAKLMVVTDSKAKLREYIKSALDIKGSIANRTPRLKDRIRRLLPFDESDISCFIEEKVSYKLHRLG